ncbi:NAD(P)/FAD-dependent oxidoreductase [Mycobacterium sp. CBMA293]|uniref:flavin-containing monooxygenase n=1 Tax=unclassified Mycolicibacterium TaxID=2636767 RepID=UPI0012DCB4DB|nr:MULTISPECIES: NAD(P)/FAD-dependent oxidoreductase [unclassified Mycolicibacterium]MUL46340.1 NAD(P)/FAD-dependent oxidoreductase [Mycolicibacterium sp. CBMA 360]MUL57148.1 NAD(P)/FAD-dependent oxidoreductase [Mycolicibacterium sp. CBMA 335]MUL70188.1 NAD(P)/FAD-dependent oxidoreductase [Mycolicibacterium sp. CBMA 311]MUL92236.1 NAD(P)/FAD-dependent oxidoreductase [Mycolicibacterium sp. CBMA 230]MUM04830.1 FAD-containing monooxygenase EthA [Mycolicibacterium sp. CBMA 213]
MRGTTAPPESVDIVIIGAGVSGVGSACYLRDAFPNKKIVVLEGRGRIGGTWDLFRYPGVRSDSELHTYGYEFKPWTHEHAVAGGHLIREYLEETAAERKVENLIRYHHRVVSADWSSAEGAWTLQVQVSAPGEKARTFAIKTNWVYGATGYYRYDEGYTPQFEGREDFAGDILHPQSWPEDYDYAGKKVVVIGSGATAITMIPAMATGPGAAEHVTMVQRTPTYVMTLPRVDKVSRFLYRILGQERGYALTRFKDMWRDYFFVGYMLKFPESGRKMMRNYTKKALPEGYAVDTHFNPPYKPWDQRMCMTPDGDFFEALAEDHVSIVTDKIERFTETGVRLASGEVLPADIIVTATGLNLRMFGGIPQTVDGEKLDVGKCVTYRGMLLSGLPNWSFAFGYTKYSSWTLKVGLTAKYVIELMRHMEARGYDKVMPVAEPGMQTEPLLDLSAGYVLRNADVMPKQGTALPWRMLTSYQADKKLLRGALVDEHLHFGRSQQSNGRFAAGSNVARTGRV